MTELLLRYKYLLLRMQLDQLTSVLYSLVVRLSRFVHSAIVPFCCTLNPNSGGWQLLHTWRGTRYERVMVPHCSYLMGFSAYMSLPLQHITIKMLSRNNSISKYIVTFIIYYFNGQGKYLHGGREETFFFLYRTFNSN